MKVEQLEYTNVINVTFSLERNWRHRHNETSEAYIVDELEARFEATEKANSWLTEQLAASRGRCGRAVENRNEYSLAADTGTSILDTQCPS